MRRFSFRLALFTAFLLVVTSLSAGSLSEDGRIGAIVDSQGITSVKPAMHSRWTPVAEPMVVKPGDWLRTGTRGANALRVRLAGGAELILGPATQVELVEGGKAKVLQGELEVAVRGKKGKLILVGPDKAERVVREGGQVLRVRDGKLETVKVEPKWLQGFKGTIAHESMGELVAKVDGRDVPLTIGYHKVSVDIRDQIARTVIEESFVNHTDARLEGVFYFPLPRDASISGFGMWIGNELVEADVVEKQRAREIYETILREKRDPGLLEWSGGNIFKARVFPIFAHSEKRIKITYTQVLPMKAGKYRYSYALQSEMLRQNPLRELAIDVKIHSARKLGGIECPTHPARLDMTAHSAHAEFSAEEYTPERDFELEMAVDSQDSNLTVVPHRRGDDGYFLMLLSPPGGSGDVDRDLIGDSGPLDFVVVADTSGSMDSTQREAQEEFVAALLSSLGPEDSFNLLACDVSCRQFSAASLEASEQNAAAALDFLSKVESLGWSDLDKAFAEALGLAGSSGQVVYVGDGIGTVGDGDAVALANRLKQLHKGKTSTCHAVATGASYEAVVMEAVASLGRGSFRRVQGADGPGGAAFALLSELSKPALKNAEIRFSGLETAGVYPGELPNIPAGTQQIVLGRYLPDGEKTAAEVVITGILAGKEETFRVKFELPGKEEGNSFIPRLWARMHLEYLLSMGRSATVKEDIIALSEEYMIMTPYTSFLVLESDADRKRFKVKRRFGMRDGEKFFAKGREAANFELLQKQMKLAGDWRIGLRRSMLEQVKRMGRDLALYMPYQPGYWDYGGYPGAGYGGWEYGVYGEDGGFGWGGALNGAFSAGAKSDYMLSTASHSMGFTRSDSKKAAESLDARVSLEGKELLLDESAPFLSNQLNGDDFEAEQSAMEPMPIMEPDMADMPAGAPFAMAGERMERELVPMVMEKQKRQRKLSAKSESFKDSIGGFGYGYGGGRGLAQGMLGPVGGSYRRYSGLDVDWSRDYHGAQHYGAYDPYWLQTIFPYLGVAPVEPKQGEKKPKWPAEIRELADRLLRLEQFSAIKGGIRMESRTETFGYVRNRLTSVYTNMVLAAPGQWLTLSRSGTDQTLLRWCDGKECGAISNAFTCGRWRESVPLDLAIPPLSMGNYAFARLYETYYYPDYTPSIVELGHDRVRLKLVSKYTPTWETHILIDTSRNIVYAVETYNAGELTTKTAYKDYVDIAGISWPQRVETQDKDGRVTSVSTYKIAELDPGALKKAVDGEMAVRKDSLLFEEPLLPMLKAKEAVKRGKAGFAAHLRLLLHFSMSQQWSRVAEHLEKFEKLAGDKPGKRWVRYAVLKESRKHAELKKVYFETARKLAKKTRPEELFLTLHIFREAQGVLQAGEMLELLEILKPVYERAPEYQMMMKQWGMEQRNQLYYMGRYDEARVLAEKLAKTYPEMYDVQSNYLYDLSNVGEYEAAYAWVTHLLENEGPWEKYEEDGLRTTYAQFLRDQGKVDDLAAYLEKWIKLNPDNQTPYQQYLGLLVRLGREAESDKLMEAWLSMAGKKGKVLPLPEQSRMYAAIYVAIGQGYMYYTNHADPKWFGKLADAVRALAAREGPDDYIIWQIVGNWDFKRSKEARKLREEFIAVLLKNAGELKAVQLSRYVNLLLQDQAEVGEKNWTGIIAALTRRWKAEKDVEERMLMGGRLVQLLASFGQEGEMLKFLRMQWKQGDKKYKDQYAGQLFDVLLYQPWSKENEVEALFMLRQLSTQAEPQPRLSDRVARLTMLSDRMVEGRYLALLESVKDKENLSRTELRALYTDSRRKAREEWSAVLAKQVKKHNDALRPWILAEQLYFDVLLRRNLGKAEAECWEFVGTKPPEFKDDDPGRWLSDALWARYLGMLEYMSVLPGAKPELGTRLLGFLARAEEATGETRRWRLKTFRHLVALDRAEELEKALRKWTKDKVVDSLWRISLGYLLAETNRLFEAIAEFEAVEAQDELTPQEYKVLADWYLVLNKKKKHDEAVMRQLETWEEWGISNWLQNMLYGVPQSADGMPAELDPLVIHAFAVLFKKSEYPNSYIWQLSDFYRRHHDFRLLGCLAEGMVGHTPQQVYPLLQGLYSVLNEIQDEATADSVLERIGQVRKKAVTPVDKRALFMLEALIERRASEVTNQPGPHLDSALKAMRRAFKGDWADGERRQMASLLEGLANISQEPLADEQLAQLKRLYSGEKKGTEDRLAIALSYSRVLWYYTKWNQAIDLLENALDEARDAHGGILPQSANDAFSTLVYNLQNRERFAHAEKLIFAEFRRSKSHHQQQSFRNLLFGLYNDALRAGGTVSLGKGAELYMNARQAMLDWMEKVGYRDLYNVVQNLTSLHWTANDQKFPGVKKDMKTFAWENLDRFLGREPYDVHSLVSTVAGNLHTIVGPWAGLEYLIAAIEKEPSWFRWSQQDGFNYHSYQLAEWRAEVRKLGPLGPRLLKLALIHLRHDLETMNNRGCSTVYYDCGADRFWSEKKRDFARVAEEVLKEHMDEGPVVEHIAEYFYDGLKRRKRAISILQDGWKRGILTDNGKSRLITMLHEAKRYRESIPLLTELLKKTPEASWYRHQLMVAYAKTGRNTKLLKFLKESEKFYRDKKLWTEGTIAALGLACVEAELFEQAVKYYEEVIPLHQRTQPGRGIGMGTLSEYYRSLSQAYTGLKNTDKAVEAACGAIVSWGASHESRQYAVESLRQVLRDAGNLEQFAAGLDKSAKESGMENPIVRKALGRIFLEKGKCGDAAGQLRKALISQPYDGQSYQALLEAYDCSKDKERALRTLEKWTGFARRDIGLFKQLGERYGKQGAKDAAERAYTNIVEAQPEESESHAMLAELRQSQDRWPEAIEQWEQVVRIRTLEPTGYLKLAEAFMHEKQWDRAGELVKTLLGKEWPAHFGDVHYEAKELQRRIEKKR